MNKIILIVILITTFYSGYYIGIRNSHIQKLQPLERTTLSTFPNGAEPPIETSFRTIIETPLNNTFDDNKITKPANDKYHSESLKQKKSPSPKELVAYETINSILSSPDTLTSDIIFNSSTLQELPVTYQKQVRQRIADMLNSGEINPETFFNNFDDTNQ